MRIVCINNMVKRPTTNGVAPLEPDKFLIIGKSYETFMEADQFERCRVVGLYEENQDGAIIPYDRVYDKNLFVTIDEWREMQLNKLII